MVLLLCQTELCSAAERCKSLLRSEPLRLRVPPMEPRDRRHAGWRRPAKERQFIQATSSALSGCRNRRKIAAPGGVTAIARRRVPRLVPRGVRLFILKVERMKISKLTAKAFFAQINTFTMCNHSNVASEHWICEFVPSNLSSHQDTAV